MEVVQELMEALQDVQRRDASVDIKSLVRGLVEARQAQGGGLAPASSSSSSSFEEVEVLKAMRGGLGNALVKRIIEEEGLPSGGAPAPLLNSDGSQPSALERLAAWGSLVVKTISSNKYLLTADKVLAMKDLADRLLPPSDVSPADLTVAHLAVVREVGNSLVDEYPEIRRRRGNVLYVLLNLALAGLRGVEHAHREEVAIGQSVSMESSLGQGCRMVFEASLSEALPPSTDMATDEAFRAAVRALGEFGEAARHVLRVTRLPADDALRGVVFVLVPWLRRVVKRALEEEPTDVAVARLGMVMELARHAAECMAAMTLREDRASMEPAAFEAAVQEVLADKVNGVGVELASGTRQAVLGAYLRNWVGNALTGRALPVAWVDGEARVRPGDMGAWDLARQVLALSEMQLLFVAKEAVPQAVGELMAEVLLQEGGEWPKGGHQAFAREFERMYKRLKYDKYEGNFARTKAVRVLADAVLAATGASEEQRSRAVEWGCQSLGLSTAEFEDLADQQASFEMQTELLEAVLGPASASASAGGEPMTPEQVGEAVAGLASRLRLRPESTGKATATATQVHIGNLAARALFADMEGQPVKAFKEIDATLRFVRETAAYLEQRFGCRINPTARIGDDDGLQLANLCTKMLSRRQFADSAREFLEMLGYSDRIY